MVALAMISPVAMASTVELPEVPAAAVGVDAFDGGEPRVEKRLIVDHDKVRRGDTITAGVLFVMDPEWHIYWHYAGQGGMSTEISIDPVPGLSGPILWPAPTVYHEAGGRIITFGYGDQVVLFSEIAIPEDAGERVEISAAVDYLVCKVDCIPGEAALTRMLEVVDEPVLADDLTLDYFQRARDAVPQTPEQAGVDVQIRYSSVPIGPSETFRMEVEVIACDDDGECLDLGPVPERAADALVYEGIDAVSFEVVRAMEHPEAASGWFVELQGRSSRDIRGEDGRFGVVLNLVTVDGEELPVYLEALFPRQDSPEARELLMGGAKGGGEADSAPAPLDGEGGLSLFYVLLLAFLGGALLNLMPCVFPVLAVKVFAFVNLVHEERQNIYLHSAAYTVGIVGSMMVLAGVVIGLQIVGTQVGWGFQFQEPIFVALVGAVVVIFALNLFGVFEVTLSPGKLQNVATMAPSARRSVGEGVLAVILATPCSAPFLGTAVGFALANSPAMIALIFFVLGLGLAMPFVVLTMTPGAARLLPRPGAWMNHFKQFLGFALLGTAVWLLWLIGQMEGVGAMTRLLSFFIGCAMAVWIFGLLQFRSTAARRVGIAVCVALIIGTGLFTLRFDGGQATGATVDAAGGPIAWKEWNEADVQAELDAGRPVFVDFTADWCITCKVNEANVLEHPSVVAAIEEYDVAMFMADWTRRDDTIRAKLAEYGKAGVPMYLLYSPDSPQNPDVLPELLTRQLVISGLERAAQ